MGDERVDRGPLLGGVDRRDRGVRGRVGREAIDRLGRHGDEAAGAKTCGRCGDRLGARLRQAGHSAVERHVSFRSALRANSTVHKLIWACRGNRRPTNLAAIGSEADRPHAFAIGRSQEMPYRSPVADILFSLSAVADLPEVIGRGLMGDLDWDSVSSIVAEAGRFATEEIAPLNRPGDLAGARYENGAVTTPPGFADVYRRWAEAGWNGVSAPAEFGGMGLPHLVNVACTEIWNGAAMAFALCPLLTEGAVHALQAHGSRELLDAYLAPMIAGKWTGTMNLTEPQAGSDLAAVRTRAVRDGDHYRITGTKIFITYGDHELAENIIHLVLARTPNAPAGVKGISLFVVPKYLVGDDGALKGHNDLRCVSLEHKMGIHASPTAVMSYGDNGGAFGLIVGEENKGLQYMFTTMNNARLSVGLQGIGIAERALQKAASFARERVQSRDIAGSNAKPVTIIHHPDIRRMLLTMRALTEASRALAYFAAAQLDVANRHPDPEMREASKAVVDLLIPVVKGWSTEIGSEAAAMGVQIHGGMGYIEEAGSSQFMRDAKISEIYEGTNGIQANDLIGRKLTRDGGATAKSFIAT